MTMLPYKIIEAPTKHLRVQINGVTYPLKVKGGRLLSDFSQRQQNFILNGSYGDLVQTYAQVALDLGCECRLNWTGVVNALGDFAEVYPPTPIE